jgi:PAS domain S-box-containing protein
MARLVPGMIHPSAQSELANDAIDGTIGRGNSGRGDEYRTLFNSIDEGFCIVEVLFDAQDHAIDYRFLRTNAAFEAQTGLENATGKTMRALRPDHEEHWFQIYGEVARTGEPIRFEREAKALGRWYNVYAFRVHEPERRRVAILFNDVTKRKREAEHLALLAAEIDHRAKNMLTIVAGLVRLTDADTVAKYKKTLMGRITALGNSQKRLSESRRRGASLAKLIEDEMAPYRTADVARVTSSGPDILLPPAFADGMAMTIHELAANAAKYGALSVAEGRARLEWSQSDDGALDLRWSEHGGPPVTAPTRQGVGTMVITRCVQDQLGGKVTFEWHPDGLRCTLIVPTQDE